MAVYSLIVQPLNFACGTKCWIVCARFYPRGRVIARSHYASREKRRREREKRYDQNNRRCAPCSNASRHDIFSLRRDEMSCEINDKFLRRSLRLLSTLFTQFKRAFLNHLGE